MKKYIVKDSIPEDISKQLDTYSPLVRQLLFNRGITVAKDAQQFINPDYGALHDPYTLKDIKRAVTRIKEAIDKKERIAIYSDYDTDGVPGAVILHDLFKKIGYENFTNYIPHRNNEGFGLNMPAIDELAKESVMLLITIDCGSADAVEITHAHTHGMDVIITDHHLMHDTVADAFAIVNPKQGACLYPEEMLCGSAVIFKLVQVFLKEYGAEYGVVSGWEKWLLDMVGIATLSDMVPLKGENRILAHYGLTVLRKTRRHGLLELFSKTGLNRNLITEDDVGFTIGPRINAASRMGLPMDAFRMLSATSLEDASVFVKHLEKINRERKSLVATMVRNIHKRMKAHNTLPAVIVLGDPDWKPSLLGLVANKLMDEYGRPVFLWGRGSGTTLKGSCRSNEIDVVTLMKSLPEGILSAYGGHSFAGGFVVCDAGVHILEQSLNDAYKNITENVATEREVVSADMALTLDEVSENTHREIVRLAPFGMDNARPLFLFKNVIPYEMRQFGKGNEHIEVVFQNSFNKEVRAIAFFSKPESFDCIPKEGVAVDMVAHMEKSVFRGKTELRLRIIDFVSE